MTAQSKSPLTGPAAWLPDAPEGTFYTLDPGPLLRAPKKPICRCPIKNLLSDGHDKGCPEGPK